MGELAEPLRSRIWTAIHDAPTGGLVLISGYRDDGRQWDLRHDRCPGRECDPACRGNPVTALPGRSNHGRRKAADMGGRALGWLITNRAAYGLGLTVRSENWHFEAEGTDSRTGRRIGAPTVRIIPYGQQPQRTPASSPIPTTKEHPLMALTDAEQTELLNIARELRGTAARKAVAVRSKTDGRVWIVSDAGRWWCHTRTALDLLLYVGQIQPIGTDGPAPVDQSWLDGIMEIDPPEGAASL